jgi:hypothetical protein
VRGKDQDSLDPRWSVREERIGIPRTLWEVLVGGKGGDTPDPWRSVMRGKDRDSLDPAEGLSEWKELGFSKPSL